MSRTCLHTLVLGLAGLATVLQAGCAGYSCHPTAPQEFPVKGKSREEVVAVVGQPVQSHSTDYGPVDVYKFESASCSGAVIPVPFIIVLPLFGTEYSFYTVAYGADGKFMSATRWSTETPDETFQKWLERRTILQAQWSQGEPIAAPIAAFALNREFNEPQPLRELAENGSEQAAWELERRVGSPERRAWLCEAAARGDRNDWVTLARELELETATQSTNLMKAYVWYLAAEKSGYIFTESEYGLTENGVLRCCYTKLTRLQQQLSAQQLKQARRMYSEWSSSDCPW